VITQQDNLNTFGIFGDRELKRMYGCRKEGVAENGENYTMRIFIICTLY
jgi:hypothetical protein